MKIQSESDAFIAMAHLCEPGDELINKKLASRISPNQVLDMLGSKGFPQRDNLAFTKRFEKFDLDAELDFAHRIGARILTRDQEGWPTQLQALGSQQPWALWAIGSIDFRVIALSSLTIVGARACTPYGAAIAGQWAAELGAWGTHVFSGGAIGVDSCAHKGALRTGTPTVSVLASGVQARYPSSNEHLFALIVENGAIVSESPPREPAHKRRFLARNRILAGLTKATCVIEATDRSGTSSTAREALNMNRIVAGVPGSIHAPTSLGVNRLLKHTDVHLVTSAADLQELVTGFNPREVPSVGATTRDHQRNSSARWRALSASDYEIWELLPKHGGMNVDNLTEKTGRSRLDLLARLSELRLTGFASNVEGLWCKSK